MSQLFRQFKKQIAFIALLIVLALTGSTFITYKQLSETYSNTHISSLEALKNSISSQLSTYDLELKRDLITFSQNPKTQQAVKALNQAFLNFPYFEESLAPLQAQVDRYYSKISFNAPNAQPQRPVEAFIPNSQTAINLQTAYIANSHLTMYSRWEIFQSPLKTTYDQQHLAYHAHFIHQLNRFEYYDLLIINPQGDIVYSVKKEQDFATNLKTGVFSNSHLATAYQQAMQLKPNQVTATDFTPYEASFNRPSAFVAKPIFENDQIVGVIALQLSIQALNDVITFKQPFNAIGMGKTGEAYLVGEDGFLRSNSRFMDQIDNPLVDVFSTTIGLLQNPYPSVKLAVGGKQDTHRTFNYLKQPVLSSYMPIHLFNQNWALLVEIQESEIHEEVYQTLFTNIFTNLALTLLLIALIWFVFHRFIIKPIEATEALLEAELTAKTEQQQQVEQLLSEYKIAVDESAIVSKADKFGNIIYVNDAFCEISGYSRNEIIGKPHSIVRHPDMLKATFKTLWQTILNKQIWKGVIKNKKKNGESYYVKTTIVPILDSQKNILEYISIRTDITDLTLNQELLTQKSLDSLTQLPNRESLFEALNAQEPTLFSIIQINQFKDIFDFYSTEIGNELTLKIQDIIQTLTTNTPIQLYKLGRDEFALLCTSCLDLTIFTKMNYNIIKYFDHNTLKVFDDLFHISLNIGLAQGQGVSLYYNAEIALRGTIEKRVPILTFEPSQSIEQEYHKNKAVTSKIKQALSQDAFEVYIQPIVSNATKNSLGLNKFECLVRMREGETVHSPYYFLDISKKARLYPAITKVIIEKSFHHFQHSENQFSINFDIEDILNPDIIHFLKRKIAQFRIGHRLVIELVESEGIENFEEVTQFIRDMKNLGCQIAIDDFGTGYSNFEYLMKLEVDYIKIDGSLIKNITTDKNSELVVELIVSFAQKQHIKTIAEFVHNQAVLDKISAMGVDFSQGYHISAPYDINTNSK